MITDAQEIDQTLLQWVSTSQLDQATLEGQKIDLNGVSLDANAMVTIENKTYTAGSIFLQIRDPKQGLMAYRNACKNYGMDPIKALDKPVILSYFYPEGTLASSADAAPTATTTTTTTTPDDTAPITAKPPSEPQPSSRKEHSHKRSSASKHHHHKSKPSPPKKKKPKPGLISNEQLLEHLATVVDKRAMNVSAAEISQALSAKGFEITDISEYKEKTARILQNEIPVGDSASVLRANGLRKNLTRVLELYLETVNVKTNTKQQQQLKSASAKKKTFKTYLIGKKPVIIVPKGMTAPITLLNAHEFLKDSKFVPRDVVLKTKQQQQPGSAQQPPTTTFTRSIKTGLTSSLLEYEILDNPRKLGNNPHEWERIVAVIVLGQAWQFKDWLAHPVAYSNPAVLFDKVYGFYLYMEGDKLPADVSRWAVRSAKLHRDKRGLDSVAYAQFWNGLDEWMKVYKAELLPKMET
jgi:parafibromin